MLANSKNLGSGGVVASGVGWLVGVCVTGSTGDRVGAIVGGNGTVGADVLGGPVGDGVTGAAVSADRSLVSLRLSRPTTMPAASAPHMTSTRQHISPSTNGDGVQHINESSDASDRFESSKSSTYRLLLVDSSLSLLTSFLPFFAALLLFVALVAAVVVTAAAPAFLFTAVPRVGPLVVLVTGGFS